MRTSKQLRTFAVASAAAMTLGLAACENGDGLDDNGFDDGVEAPAEDGLDDDGRPRTVSTTTALRTTVSTTRTTSTADVGVEAITGREVGPGLAAGSHSFGMLDR